MSKATPFQISLYGVRLRTIPPREKLWLGLGFGLLVLLGLGLDNPNSPKKDGRLD